MRYLALLLTAAACTLQPACTPEHRAPLRTALEVNQCINGLVLRHIDAGDDLADRNTLTLLAAEIASECTPTLLETR
jgi:hypothetical protein